ncbi:V(D)J recombination-activating protein 1-like [Amphiura filiformis]|uniref:V(D)J recombination-activating protein 1-like n=1 Tax=Amphiura filiformis TaxID=82378 RepID=UPI003B222D06
MFFAKSVYISGFHGFSCCGTCLKRYCVSRDIKQCDAAFCELVLDLPMRCINDNCEEMVTVRNFESHISTCKRTSLNDHITDDGESSLDNSVSSDSSSPSSSPSSSSKRGRPPKPVLNLEQPAQNARLRTLKNGIKQHAQHYGEDLKTVYYALILNHLRSTKKWTEYSTIKSLLTGESSLNSTKCLAIRVTAFMSVKRYRKVQQVTNAAADKRVFEPYASMKNAEKAFLPGCPNVRFTVTPPLQHHCPSMDGESVGGFQYMPQNFPELGLPHVKAERYHYDKALATSLSDLEPQIANGLRALGKDPATFTGTLQVVVKDGGDGMGDVSRKMYMSANKLPDKALRYSFCVLKIYTINQNGEQETVFEETRPNSQLNCRPLLIALADENDYYTFTSLTGTLFMERHHLEHSTLHLHNTFGSSWDFKFNMFSTMFDEKLERKVAGLAGPSSTFLCTMCETRRHDAYETPFGHRISRNSYRNEENLDRKLTNDSGLSYNKLLEESKGVTTDSFINMTSHIDALHCEINNALWFKKLFVREIAKVNERKWTYGSNEKREKEALKQAEEILNDNLRTGMGLQKYLMQPGNYSRLLLTDKAMAIILPLIPENRREYVQQLVDDYNLLKPVWKATKPTESCPDLLKKYDENASKFIVTLKMFFSYTKQNMPNYLHKTLAHVPELIEKYGSVGAFSSEPNEHGNKLFRLFRKMNARQQSDFELKDILKFHWLYTVKSIHELADRTSIHQKCSFCAETGHKRTTCPSRLP